MRISAIFLHKKRLYNIYWFYSPTNIIQPKVLGEDETATDKQLAVPTPAANDNFTFKEWQENIDENTPITSERIHVAIFQSGQVTLTYDKGGEDVTGELPANVSVNVGTSVGLAGPGNLAKANSVFAGWKLDDDETIYQAGDQVKLEKARTATAQWKSSAYTVSFNSMGGSEVSSQTVDHGKTATEPNAPKLDGKVFMGWKEKETDTSYFDFSTPITADKTLIAIWQDIVQKIGDGDKVEEQFIKVTFLKGAHGTLKEGQDENIEKVTYKVAKELSFEEAREKGMTVPEIAPDKYYKAADENSGWDKALKLAGKNIEFTALYEPEADVIPVDPQVTDEEEIKKEKPEGMVLVTFVVDEQESYMDGVTKYYVAINKEVEIPSPLVFNKIRNHEFKGWNFNDQVTMEIKGSFDKDTVISDKLLGKPTIHVKIPTAGIDFIIIEEMTDGAEGKLEVMSNGATETYGDVVLTKRVRQGRKYVNKDMHGFSLKQALKQGDIIKFWAVNENGESEVYKYIIK